MGNPTQFCLTPGQAHDLQGADALLPGVEANFFLADKADDAQERVIDQLQAKNCQIVIPSKSSRIQQREYARHLYKARHLIENFFATLDSLLNGGNLRNATVSQIEAVSSARNSL